MRRFVSRAMVGALTMAIWICPLTVNAHLFTVDQQQNTVGNSIRVLPFHDALGQEFIPTLTSLDVVELNTADITGNGVGRDLQVRIRDGSITGSIEGTSSIVSLPSGFGLGVGATTHFDFPSSVPLVPGNPYVIEVFLVGANPTTNEWGINYEIGNPYSGGQVIVSGGLANVSEDLFFREGPIPEPTTLLLFGVGMMGVGVGTRRRRKKS